MNIITAEIRAAALRTIRGPIVSDPARAAEIMQALRAAASGRSSMLTCETVTRRPDYPAFVADWDALMSADGAVD